MPEFHSLRVYRIYFHPGAAPSRNADFEMVALPYPNVGSIKEALAAGDVLRGLRLIGWPAPGDKTVRLIDRTWLLHIEEKHVREVETCGWRCMFRPSAEDTAAQAGA